MDIKDIRLANMLRLVAQHGSIKELAEVTDTPATYLSNLKNKAKANGVPRAMGDDVARRIEEKLSLPHGWMDASHDLGIGATARRIREERGLTLEQVASESDTDSGNLSRFERGLQGFSEDGIRKVAAALGVHPGELFGLRVLSGMQICLAHDLLVNLRMEALRLAHSVRSTNRTHGIRKTASGDYETAESPYVVDDVVADAKKIMAMVLER